MDNKVSYITITNRAGETRVIDAPTLEGDEDEIGRVGAGIDSDDVQTKIERLLNENQTMFERDSDDVETEFERESDDVETSLERRRQTEAATAEKAEMPAVSPRDFCEIYAGVVKLLDNKKFIYRVTNRRGLKHSFSVPKKVTEAINKELGMNLKPAMVNKIQFCRLYQKRFSPFTFYSVVVAAVTILTLVIWPASPKQKGEKIENETTTVAVFNPDFNLKAEVRKWEKEHRYFFSGWRLTHDIANCNISDAAELAKFLQQQRKIQGSSFTEPQVW